MGVAEAGEGVRFTVPVAKIAEQDEGLLVTGYGLGVVPEVVVGEAQAVQGVRLPYPVAELPEQQESLLACCEGPEVIVEQTVVPPDVVQRGCLPPAVVRCPEHDEGLLSMVKGLIRTPLRLPHTGKIEVGPGLADEGPGPDVEVEGAEQGFPSLGVPAEQGVGPGEQPMGVRLRYRVVQARFGGV